MCCVRTLCVYLHVCIKLVACVVTEHTVPWQCDPVVCVCYVCVPHKAQFFVFPALDNTTPPALCPS